MRMCLPLQTDQCIRLCRCERSDTASQQTFSADLHFPNLLVNGLNPCLTTARANISGVSSGLSERSMSLSAIVFRRFQAVRDFFEAPFLSIFRSPSGVDDWTQCSYIV